MSDQKRDMDSLFEAASNIKSAEERAAFLAESCGDDVQLRRQIEQLLESDRKAGSFLEKPPAELESRISPESRGDGRTASLEAGLAAAFSVDQTVVIGDKNHSVLKMLGNTLDEVPHVALRESAAEGADPIARPSSPEIPKSESDGRYQLQGEIARGGMGAIIKGRDTDLGRDLAIKVLLDSHKDKPEVIQRFVEEAQIGGQLQHPGIAPIYELGQFADKRPFFAMKLVKGQTLSKLLADREEATDERARFIGIFEQVCQTMAYAHSRGVIHRDLKPANIMVGAFGEVQVMDWGLAKVLKVGGVADEKKSKMQQGQSIIQTLRSGVGGDAQTTGSQGSEGSETRMGSVMGTPAYMPPEQALGEIDQLDERADVFGLGAILCEILTGQPPYVADDGEFVFRMASRGKLAEALSRLDTCSADQDLITLTKQCLELEPVERPRDAGVLADHVTKYLESVEAKLREAEVKRAAEAARADAETARTAAETQRAEAEAARATEESRRRRTSLALAASILLLFGIGGGGLLYMKNAEAVAERQHAIEMQKALAEARDAETRARSAKSESVRREEEAQRRLNIVQDFAMVLAMRGDPRDTEIAVNVCEMSGASKVWSEMLRAQSEMVQQVKIPAAIRRLERASELEDIHQLSCLALLAYAYILDGDSDGSREIEQRIRDIKPRTTTEKLFFGNAFVSDPDKCWQLANEALRERDSILARYIRAKAAAMHAINANELDIIHTGLKDLDRVQEVVPETAEQLALRCHLYLAGQLILPHADLPARQYSKLANDWRNAGGELVTRLAGLPESPPARYARAWYLDALGTDDQARAAWMDVLENGSNGWLAYQAATILYIDNDVASARNYLKGDNTMEQLALAAVLSRDPEKHDECNKIYKALRPRNSTARFFGGFPLEILLDLGELDKLKADASALLSDGKQRSDFDQLMLSYFANPQNESATLSQLKSFNRLDQIQGHTLIGRHMMVEEPPKIEEAKQQFKKARQLGVYTSGDYFWAKAYLKLLQE